MTRDCFISNLLFKPTKKTPLKLEDFQNPWRYFIFIYVVEEPYNIPIPFMFLALVFSYVFIPTGSSLDKGTIISYLDDSNSLLIGLFAPKCSFSTFPTIWPDRSFQITNVIKSFACCSVAHLCPPLLRPSWTAAHQAPLSMEFSQQEHWSGLPFPFPGDLPNPGIEPASPALAGRFFGAWEAPSSQYPAFKSLQWPLIWYVMAHNFGLWGPA